MDDATTYSPLAPSREETGLQGVAMGEVGILGVARTHHLSQPPNGNPTGDHGFAGTLGKEKS